MMQTDVAKVKDLYVASFIYSQNIELLRTEQENRFYWFIFSSKQECDRLAELFWTKKGTVDPKAFADAIKTLKDIIYSR